MFAGEKCESKSTMNVPQSSAIRVVVEERFVDGRPLPVLCPYEDAKLSNCSCAKVSVAQRVS